MNRLVRRKTSHSCGREHNPYQLINSTKKNLLTCNPQNQRQLRPCSMLVPARNTARPGSEASGARASPSRIDPAREDAERGGRGGQTETQTQALVRHHQADGRRSAAIDLRGDAAAAGGGAGGAAADAGQLLAAGMAHQEARGGVDVDAQRADGRRILERRLRRGAAPAEPVLGRALPGAPGRPAQRALERSPPPQSRRERSRRSGRRRKSPLFLPRRMYLVVGPLRRGQESLPRAPFRQAGDHADGGDFPGRVRHRAVDGQDARAGRERVRLRDDAAERQDAVPDSEASDVTVCPLLLLLLSKSFSTVVDARIRWNHYFTFFFGLIYPLRISHTVPYHIKPYSMMLKPGSPDTRSQIPVLDRSIVSLKHLVSPSPKI